MSFGFLPLIGCSVNDADEIILNRKRTYLSTYYEIDEVQKVFSRKSGRENVPR